ncbi:UDP-sugar pyrophosphorylase [Actinidia rufa]|uniref:UDP-sugar pyrophosphorylase n=1 Tax=Actinidia rufa TaxID=165716 RepID=A0A7J0EGG9_9ERIC|nr:UDP-sugar pyrophosphorylase [Actinidia rufa]
MFFGLGILLEVLGRAVKVVELGNCIAIVFVLLVGPDYASLLFPSRAWHQKSQFCTLDASILVLFFPRPSYKDSTKSSFKSSTRLECMMQDYPKTLPPTARVGFTQMDTWLAYAPVKNNPEDAAKVPKGNPYHSATSGEMAIYRANSLMLRKAGVKVDDPVLRVFNGQEVEVWSQVIWSPKWAFTFADDLSLDGALVIDAVEDAAVKVGGSVQNKGWVFENVDYKDTSAPEEVRIRGFRINRVEQLEKSLL